MADKVDDTETIARLLKIDSSDGSITYNSFALSEDDRAEEDPALSVWALRLTKPIEARRFMRPNSGYEHYADFEPSEIRNLRPDPENPSILSLDVEWRPLPEAECINDAGERLAGADGHCGIVGFKRSKGAPNLKSAMVSLRVQLAQMAKGRVKPITA
jgi:hypothetical protein